MAELYFTKGSCGAATYIASRRGEVNFTSYNIVSFADHTLVKDNSDYLKVNPKGNVPAIRFADGSLLNENVGTLYWVGKNSKNNLLGTSAMDEYASVNLLGYLASEVHAACHLLFEKSRENGRIQEGDSDKLMEKLEFISTYFLDNGKKKFLVGSDFTVADSYLYIMLTWPDMIGLDISEFTVLVEYKERIGSLPFVKDAIKEMQQIEAEQLEQGRR